MKFTDDQLRALCAEGISQKMAAERLGVSAPEREA